MAGLLGQALACATVPAAQFHQLAGLCSEATLQGSLAKLQFVQPSQLCHLLLPGQHGRAFAAPLHIVWLSLRCMLPGSVRTVVTPLHVQWPCLLLSLRRVPCDSASAPRRMCSLRPWLHQSDGCQA